MATPNTVSKSNEVTRDCHPFLITLLLLGGEAVGKSCLVERFVTDQFRDKPRTIGSTHVIHSVNFDNRTVKFDIWYTPDHKILSRISQAAIIVYDITNMRTFTTAKNWVKLLKCQASPNIVLALSGNKADLAYRREVELEEAQVFAQENNLLFMETSALTAQNVTEIFVAIAMKICKTIQGAGDKENNTILLHLASQHGHHDAVQKLLKSGADVNIATSNNGWSPLMIASEKGHYDIVMTLFGAGARVDHTDKNGKKALDVAVKNGYKNVAEVLMACQTKIFSTMARQFHYMHGKKEQQCREVRQQKDEQVREIWQQKEKQHQYVRQQKEQTEQQLKDKEQTEQQLQDVRQQNEQAEQEIKDIRQQKEQTEQQLRDVRQQKELAEQQLRDVRQQNEQAEQQIKDVRQQKEQSNSFEM
ncbi:hypothetical protein EMCRGX_G006896 [Ephydatia muelleri]